MYDQPNDGLPIAIAVICEQWTNGGEVLDTFVMLTTPPNALIARITDRMPASPNGFWRQAVVASCARQ